MNHLETGFSRTDSEEECWSAGVLGFCACALSGITPLLHYSKNTPDSQIRFNFKTVLYNIDSKEIL